MQKRGKILVENIIFIIITLVFLSILVVFIAKQGAGAKNLEQSYAKQIVLLIDSAKPGMVIHTDMKDAVDNDEEWFLENFDQVVRINDNIVTVKISDKGGYSYSFFNDVEPVVEVYPKGEVVILIR